MKLNLLPAKSSKGAGPSGVWGLIPALLIAAGGIGWMVYIKGWSESQIAKQNERIAAAKPDAEAALKISQEADSILAESRGYVLNINLAEAMDRHNAVYPALYDDVRRYIPPYFRVTSMSAAPASAQQCTVTLTGVIKSFQQYADLMGALYRIPGVASVTRAGFSDDFSQVPGLIETDQTGRPFRPGSESRIPDDAMERLEAQIANAAGNQDFTGTGGFGAFGAAADTRRGAMPEHSEITINIVLNRDITTPDPRGTLATAAGLWPAQAAASGAAGAPAAGTAPGRPPVAPPNRGGQAEEDDL